MKKTFYINSEGRTIKAHVGEPRKIESFLKASENAIRIDINEFIGQAYFVRHFHKTADGRWIGEIFRGCSGWMRQILIPKKSLIQCVNESISNEEAETILSEEALRILPHARKAIRWCDIKDVDDENGRYWLSSYSGAGVYRLIVQNGKILGAIYGGLHDSRCVICSQDAWVLALRKAIEERVQGEYQLLKADGSGTYFYLINKNDAKYLKTECYEVPSVDGGCHLNIEVK